MSTITRALRSVALGGIFLVPFVPLIIMGSLFFPFITGKNLAFRAIVEVIFFAWLALAYLDPLYRPRRTLIAIAYSVFFGVITLASILGEDFSKSFWSNAERMDGLITHLHLFAYFLVATSVLNTEKLWGKFFHTTIGISISIGVYGVLQLFDIIPTFQGQTRIESTFGNAIYLAVYMLFHIFFTAYYLFEKNKAEYLPYLYGGTAFSLAAILILVGRGAPGVATTSFVAGAILFLATYYFFREKGQKYLPYFYGAIALFQAVVLYFTATRGALLGFIGGIFLVALVYLFSGSGAGRRVALGILGFVIVLVAVFFVSKNTEFVRTNNVLRRFASLSLTERTVESRFTIWKMSFEGFKESPALGYGIGNFEPIFNKYYKPSLWRQEPWFDRAHNVVFDWLIAAGALGFLSYLALVGSAVFSAGKHAFKEFPVGKSLFIGLLGAYFFQNLFAFDNITSYFLFTAVIAFINTKTYDADKREYLHRLASWFSGVKRAFSLHKAKQIFTEEIVAGSALTAFIIVFYFLNVPMARANYYLLQAITSHDTLEKNYSYFEKTLAQGSSINTEATEQLMRLSSEIATHEEVPEIDRNKFITRAIEEAKKRLEEDLDNVRTLFLYGTYLLRYGDPAEALTILERALALAPYRQIILFSLADAHRELGNSKEATSKAKEAYDLDPSYEEAAYVYAIILMTTGNVSEGQKILVEHFGTDTPPDMRFVTIYASKGMFGKASLIWEKFVQNYPDNTQYRVSLAATYFLSGQTQKSIAALQEAINRDPNFKSQGEFLINEIRAGRNPIR